MTFISYAALIFAVYELYKTIEFKAIRATLGAVMILGDEELEDEVAVIMTEHRAVPMMALMLAELLYIAFCIVLIFAGYWYIATTICVISYVNFKINKNMKYRSLYSIFNLTCMLALLYVALY